MIKNCGTISYTKHESAFIKGILIVVMVIHHLFALDTSQAYVDGYIWQVVGRFGKICVASYAFSSGYGLFFSNVHNNVKKTISRIFNLLLRYWICLSIILIFDFITSSISLSSANIIDVLLGYACIYFKYNPNAWFILPYFCFVVILPLTICLISKIKNKKIAFVIDLLCILVPFCVSAVAYMQFNEVSFIYNLVMYNVIFMLPFFSIGAVFAKYNIFNRIPVFRNSFINFLTGAILLILVFFIRRNFTLFIYGMNGFDLILAPAFIFSLLLIKSSITFKLLENCFLLFGKMSTNIWLISFLFTQGALNKLVSFSGVAVICFIITMLFCVIASYIIDKIYDTIMSIIRPRIQKQS